MKVLIVEKEMYLAQSINSKLSEISYECILSDGSYPMNKEFYDVILISNNIQEKILYSTIQNHKKNSVIILMVSYISSETISKPLKFGVDDYILKPFMMEELLRKIAYLRDYRSLKKINSNYKNYMKYILEDFKKEYDLNLIKLPLILLSKNKRTADSFVFYYSIFKEKNIIFIDLAKEKDFYNIDNISSSELIYAVNFNKLRENNKNDFLNFALGKNVFISSNEDLKTNIEHKVLLEDIVYENSLLSIEDYVKCIITNYQKQFTDLEISKRLGISRKSLWEKRKKYGLERKTKRK